MLAVITVKGGSTKWVCDLFFLARQCIKSYGSTEFCPRINMKCLITFSCFSTCSDRMSLINLGAVTPPGKNFLTPLYLQLCFCLIFQGPPDPVSVSQLQMSPRSRPTQRSQTPPWTSPNDHQPFTSRLFLCSLRRSRARSPLGRSTCQVTRNHLRPGRLSWSLGPTRRRYLKHHLLLLTPPWILLLPQSLKFMFRFLHWERSHRQLLLLW